MGDGSPAAFSGASNSDSGTAGTTTPLLWIVWQPPRVACFYFSGME
jgi:hypothetical protein